MTRARAAAPSEPPTPETMLRRASLARTSLIRAKYAKRGLSHRGTLDRTDWRRGAKGQLMVGDLFEHLHDFADVRRLEHARGWTRA